ncbi:multicopper oxidase [Apiospora kogelbergensis]|uniref:multicopper oxidase n=1 Tax=Apiospora kogelbergensis TaxID=1337665 RepID=UPI00312F69C0
MLNYAAAVAFLSLLTPSLTSPALQSNTLISARDACAGNTADTRSEWCDYSIDTDYSEEAPETGVTREYYFELLDSNVSPDGVERYAMSINGSIPGPTIYADWGDTVVVHVTNSLADSTNGTSIHFHGIRQNYTNQHDGVTSITQCPTPVGSTITYIWRALQYGSTWYHSHYSLQAWEGVFGGIVINGPATANYDEDMGIMFLNDWDHDTVDALYLSAQTSGPPTLDNGLINGTNVYGDDDHSDQTGFRWNATWVEGSSYRLRLVNAAVDTHWKFSIDNHSMTVIAMDLVPITPFTTNVLSMGMGQRYDVVVTADQASIASSFWLRAIPQSSCSDNDSSDNIRGIIYYANSTDTPTTTGFSFTDSCEDEDVSNLVPYISKTVGDSGWSDSEAATVAFNDDSLFRWYLNSTTMVVEWVDPTILKVYNNETSFVDSNGVIEIDDEEWVYLAIQTTLAVPHPIHLHGHDYYVLAQGSGTYNSSTTLNLANPPGGTPPCFLRPTDNPGAWLMHCHIGWHTSEGFALQFVERRSEMLDLIDYNLLNSTCAAWETYTDSVSVVQDDSGV